MTKPFPTIWYVGNTAMFRVGKHTVVAPLKFGSSNRAEHFIPLLYRLWEEHPFSVRGGRLVQRYTKQIDGVRKEVEENPAHKLFAAFAYRHLDYEWTEVTAKNENFLLLTVENIVPVRNPDAPATDAEKLHRANQQVREAFFNGSLQFFMRFGARFLHAHSDVLTTAQRTYMQTEWVKAIRSTESQLAADLKRDGVENQNFEEHNISLMTRPNLVVEFRPENYPDGVVYTKPKAKVHTSSNRPGVGDNEDDAADVKPARIPPARFDNDYHAAEGGVPARGYEPFTNYDVSRETYRATLQGHWNNPSTEAVLNRHGWVTPANGHHPTYEGKGFNALAMCGSSG